MFPDFALPDHWPWLSAAVAVLGDMVLFLLARGPVALRPPRIGVVLLLAIGAHGVLVLLGRPLQEIGEIVVTGTALILAIGLISASRTLVLKATQDGLREQIQTACSGLFLKCEEGPPGKYLLSTKGATQHLDTWRLARSIQIVHLPRAGGSPKVVLLVQWLSKQYPGPVPRVRIPLKRRPSCPSATSK